MATYLLNAFAQGNKSVIFEDATLKCGLIRTITEVQAEADCRLFSVKLKMFVRNKSAA